MASVTFRLNTVGHEGPLRLIINFSPRGEGDQICMIHREKDMNEDNYLWMFKNKTKMVLYPKTAFSTKF